MPKGESSLYGHEMYDTKGDNHIVFRLGPVSHEYAAGQPTKPNNIAEMQEPASEHACMQASSDSFTEQKCMWHL